MLANPIADRFAELRQWATWRRTRGGGKIPLTKGGAPAKSNDPTTWLTLREAEALVRGVEPENGGVVLALTPELRLLVVDFDGVLQVNRITDPLAREFILAAQSYTEITPSRKGLHVWLELDEPWIPTRSKLPSAEVYAQRRFMSLTGWQIRYDGTYAVIDPKRSFPLRKVSIVEAKLLLGMLGYTEAPPAPSAPSVAPAASAEGAANLRRAQLYGMLRFLAAQHPTSENRNGALFWCANRLREAGIPQEHAERLLVPIVEANGLPRREAILTVASAYGTYHLHKGRAT